MKSLLNKTPKIKWRGILTKIIIILIINRIKSLGGLLGFTLNIPKKETIKNRIVPGKFMMKKITSSVQRKKLEHGLETERNKVIIDKRSKIITVDNPQVIDSLFILILRFGLL